MSAVKSKVYEGGASNAMMGKGKSFNVDEIIKTLLSNKVRNIGLTGEISEQNLIELIEKARDIFTFQPVFLELTAPVKIVSDIHG
jgi:serine/threonine-protein phosphatase PP1 catalytic subunit